MKCPHCPISNGSPCDGETVRPNFCAMAETGTASALGLIRDVSAKNVPPALPPLYKQAGNALSAVGTVMADLLHGSTLLAPESVYEARAAICDVCPFWLADVQRCAKCGCHDFKRRLASMSCPDSPPRWLSHEESVQVRGTDAHD